MRPIVTEVTHAVVYVDFSLIGHTGEPCENGRTDQDVVWVADSCRSKEQLGRSADRDSC